MDIKKFKKTKVETIETRVDYYEQNDKIDLYLQDKISKYLKDSGFKQDGGGCFVGYVYIDSADWESIEEICEQKIPKDKDELMEYLYKFSLGGMLEAQDNLEHSVHNDIKRNCLTDEEWEYIENFDVYDFFSDIFIASYDDNEIWERLREMRIV